MAGLAVEVMTTVTRAGVQPGHRVTQHHAILPVNSVYTMIMSLKHDHSALDWTLATRAVTANLLQCPEKAPTMEPTRAFTIKNILKDTMLNRHLNM